MRHSESAVVGEYSYARYHNLAKILLDVFYRVHISGAPKVNANPDTGSDEGTLSLTVCMKAK